MSNKHMKTTVNKRPGYLHIETSRYICAMCKDSLVCPTCHGWVAYVNDDRVIGCTHCDYTGICPHCTRRRGA